MDDFETWDKETYYLTCGNYEGREFTYTDMQAAYEAGRKAAFHEAVAEWEKPYGLTDGRSFIERLRGMV
jgi:hypothetical protein